MTVKQLARNGEKTFALVGKSDDRTYGGQLLEARVRATLEIVLAESPTRLRRVHDEESGLALIDLEP